MILDSPLDAKTIQAAGRRMCDDFRRSGITEHTTTLHDTTLNLLAQGDRASYRSCRTTATLGPTALGGFGALVGKRDELLELFPAGATMTLTTEELDITSVYIRRPDRVTAERGMPSVAEQDFGHATTVGHLTTIDITGELQDSQTLAAAGSYVANMVMHAIRRPPLR
jgi:hypothetical protein